jgi:short-subunit dehydrogenase
VIIVDINEEEAIRTASAISERFNVKTKAYKVDVSNFEALQELRQNISKDFNGQTIDILINNAGILSAISLHEGHHTQIQKIVDVNMTSHLWVRCGVDFKAILRSELICFRSLLI